MPVASAGVGGSVRARAPVRRSVSAVAGAGTGLTAQRRWTPSAVVGPARPSLAALMEMRRRNVEAARARTRAHYAGLRRSAVQRREQRAQRAWDANAMRYQSGEISLRPKPGEDLDALERATMRAAGWVAHNAPAINTGSGTIATRGGLEAASRARGRGLVPGAALVAPPVGMVRGNRFATNLVKDLVNFPTQTVLGVARPAGALLSGHPVRAAQMFVDPLVETAKHPAKTFMEHPISTTLIAAGAGRGGSRLAGTGGRLVGAGWAKTAPRASREAFARGERSSPFERPVQEGGRLTDETVYSRDPVAKGIQVAYESGRIPGSEPWMHRQRGAPVVEGRVMSPGLVRSRGTRRANFLEERGQVATRGEKMETYRALSGRPGSYVDSGARSLAGEASGAARRAGAALNVPARLRERGTAKAMAKTNLLRLILEGELRPATFNADLAGVRARYAREAETLTGDKLAVSTRNRELLDAALAEPGLVARVARDGFAVARRTARLNERRERGMVEQGVLAPARVKAKYVRALQAHAGARMGERGLSEVGLGRAARRQAVREAEVQAGRVRRTARVVERQAAREQGRAGVLVGQADRRLLAQDASVRAAARERNAAGRELRNAREGEGIPTAYPRARQADEPRLDDLLRAVRESQGQPGISQERAYMAGLRAYSDSETLFVARNASGKPVGVLDIHHEPGGRAASQASVVVAGHVRRSGIGSRLLAAAQKAGFKLRKDDENVYTEAGEALARAYRHQVAAGQELRKAGDSGNGARIREARARSDAARWEYKQAAANAYRRAEMRGQPDARSASKRDPMEGLGRQPTATVARAGRAEADLLAVRRAEGQTRQQVRAAKAEERAYRAETRGRRTTEKPWMLDREGRAIRTAEEARRILEAEGVDTSSIAHVSGLPREQGTRGGAYARPSTTRGEWADSHQRTGRGGEQGALDLSAHTVLDDAARKGSKLAVARNATAMFQSFLVGPLHRTSGEAKKYVHALQHREFRNAAGELVSERRSWVPEMRVVNFADLYQKMADVTRRAEAMKLTDDAGAKLGQEILDELAELPAKREGVTGRYGVFPEEAMATFEGHLKASPSGDTLKTFQTATAMFRRTVLLTSTRWLAGNVIEMMVRTVLTEGMGLRAWATGRKVERTMQQLDPEQAFMARAGIRGFGAHFGSLTRHQLYRQDPAMWNSAVQRGVAQAVRAWRLGGANPVQALWTGYAAMIRGLNTWAEAQGDLAIIGKTARRDWRDITGSWVESIKLSEGAYQDLARGLFGTARQERYARQLDLIRGKYSRFGPGMRRVMQNYSPFVAWYVNALRFVYVTLPGRHPVKTAALAGLYNGETDRLTKEGETLLLGAGGAKPKPGYLLQAPGGHPVGRYTPFGIFAQEGGPLASAAHLLLPQFGWVEPLRGRNWKGDRMKDSQGQPTSLMQNAGLGIYTMAESMIPGIALTRRILESGQSTADTSTVFAPRVKGQGAPKRDLSEGAWKTLNPFHAYAKPEGAAVGVPDDIAKEFEQEAGPEEVPPDILKEFQNVP